MSEWSGKRETSGTVATGVVARLTQLGVPQEAWGDLQRLSDEFATRGLEGWAAEALAVSVIGVGELRSQWDLLVTAPDRRDGIFALGDCWGDLVAAEALLEGCLREVVAGHHAGIWLADLSALCLSVGLIREGIGRVAEGLGGFLTRGTSLSSDTRAIAERIIQG